LQYITFFSTTYFSTHYTPTFAFRDPLSVAPGIDAYKSNIDVIAGRSALGSFLFTDSSILLHSVTRPTERNVRTRWTLSTTVGALPWKPRLVFTGVR